MSALVDSKSLSRRRRAANDSRHTKAPNDLLGDSVGRFSRIDCQRVLTWFRLFERIDLTAQQRRGHEMALPFGNMLGHKVEAATKVDQSDLRAIPDDELAICPLERRARDNPGLLLGALSVDPGCHAFQPRLAVRVGQRNSGMHLGNIDFGMKRVALLKGPAEARGKLLGDCRFARTRNSHDDQNWRTAPVRAGAVEAVDASCVSNKDRVSAANEQAAFDHPDDVPNAFLQSGRVADAIEVTIENAVAAVGDEGLVRRRHAQVNAGTEHFKRLPSSLQSESDDFHGD